MLLCNNTGRAENLLLEEGLLLRLGLHLSRCLRLSLSKSLLLELLELELPLHCRDLHGLLKLGLLHEMLLLEHGLLDHGVSQSLSLHLISHEVLRVLSRCSTLELTQNFRLKGQLILRE